jgi:hypothetical protein
VGLCYGWRLAVFISVSRASRSKLPVTVSATLNPVALSPPYNWIQFDAVHTGDRAFHQLFSSTAILHVAAVLLYKQK